MDEKRNLVREFFNVNFQIEALQKLITELEARRQTISNEIQAEIARAMKMVHGGLMSTVLRSMGVMSLHGKCLTATQL
jgi:acyl-coenzyme A thioesterase PaaI-like protein